MLGFGLDFGRLASGVSAKRIFFFKKKKKMRIYEGERGVKSNRNTYLRANSSRPRFHSVWVRPEMTEKVVVLEKKKEHALIAAHPFSSAL